MKYILLIIILIILFFFITNCYVKGINIIKIIENFDENIIFNNNENNNKNKKDIDNVYENKIKNKDYTINYENKDLITNDQNSNNDENIFNFNDKKYNKADPDKYYIMIDNNIDNSSEKIIWMYWETLPGKKKPGYIDLCINSVKHNCGKCFKIIVLNEKSIKNYLPNISLKLSNLNLPQKVDYYRYALLEKYGGVWLDADILVLKCICPYYKKLEKYDYVGFGCGYDRDVCKETINGHSRPLNWFMISKPNTNFIKCVKKNAENEIVKSIETKTKIPYHGIGKTILSKCYDKLNKEEKWDYYHVSSKCQEYDSYGNKLNNIMNKFNWEDCDDERIFFPLYNTAPGYPDWFKDLNEEELKNSDLYIRPIIDKAFSKNISCK
jgi:mannosyltransferase OCH1-like enzyme